MSQYTYVCRNCEERMKNRFIPPSLRNMPLSYEAVTLSCCKTKPDNYTPHALEKCHYLKQQVVTTENNIPEMLTPIWSCNSWYLWYPKLITLYVKAYHLAISEPGGINPPIHIQFTLALSFHLRL